MQVHQIQSLSPDCLFENFDVLTKLEYHPSQEFAKQFQTSRILEKEFQEKKTKIENLQEEKVSFETLRAQTQNKNYSTVMESFPRYVKFSNPQQSTSESTIFQLRDRPIQKISDSMTKNLMQSKLLISCSQQCRPNEVDQKPLSQAEFTGLRQHEIGKIQSIMRTLRTDDKENDINIQNTNPLYTSDYDFQFPAQKKRKSGIGKLLLNHSTKEIASAANAMRDKFRLSQLGQDKQSTDLDRRQSKKNESDSSKKHSAEQYFQMSEYSTIKPSIQPRKDESITKELIAPQKKLVQYQKVLENYPDATKRSRRETIQTPSQDAEALASQNSTSQNAGGRRNANSSSVYQRANTSMNLLRKCLEQKDHQLVISRSKNLIKDQHQYTEVEHKFQKSIVPDPDNYFLNRSIDDTTDHLLKPRASQLERSRVTLTTRNDIRSLVQANSRQVPVATRILDSKSFIRSMAKFKPLKKSTDKKGRSQYENQNLQRSKSKINKGIKSLGKMIKMKNSSSNLLKRINSKLGYLDCLEVQENAKNCFSTLAHGPKLKKSSQPLSSHHRLNTEGNESGLRYNFSVKEINQGIKQLQEANSGLLLKKSSMQPRIGSIASFAEKIIPNHSHISSAVTGQTEQERFAKIERNLSANLDFPKGFLSTRDGTSNPKKLFTSLHPGESTNKTKLCSFLRQQQNLKSRSKQESNSSNKNAQCIYRSILQNYINQ